MITQEDGKIFGGAVRDSILHDHFAELFYNDPRRTQISYDNELEFTEYKDRLVIPADVDAVISKKNMPKLMDNINKFYTVKRISRRDPSNYNRMMQIEQGQMIHHKYELVPLSTLNFIKQINQIIPTNIFNEFTCDIYNFIGSLNLPKIKLDLFEILSDIEIDPPFGNLDFECNGLILDKYKIRLSSILENIYNIKFSGISKSIQVTTKIIDDIIHKRAIMVPTPLSSSRTKKLYDKGWTIIQDYKNFENITEKNYSGNCIICMDSVSDNHLKMKCCDARYHDNCLHRAISEGPSCMLTTRNCLLCRGRLHGLSTDSVKFTTYIRAVSTVPIPVALDTTTSRQLDFLARQLDFEELSEEELSEEELSQEEINNNFNNGNMSPTSVLPAENTSSQENVDTSDQTVLREIMNIMISGNSEGEQWSQA